MARVRTVLAVAAVLVAVTAAPAVAAPPATTPPTGLGTTAVTATTVGLAWNAVSGATSYQVLRGTPTTSLAVVAGTSATSWTDTGRTPGTAYTYAVATVSKKGPSAPTAALTITTVPAAPASLTATATGTSTASLSWSASAGSTSYQVWRSTGTAAPALRTTVAADALTFTDTGLTAGTTYRWTVRASDASGTSGDSPAATATTAAPPVPKLAPTVQVTGSPSPSAVGDRVVFTVVVASPNPGTAVPTGPVSLRLQGSTVSSVLNPNGVATFDWIFGSAGSWPVTAAYSGDTRFAAANGSTTQTVTASPSFGPYVAYPTNSWTASVVTADVDGDGVDEAVVSSRLAVGSDLLTYDFGGSPSTPTVTRLATGSAYPDKAQLAAGDLDGDGADDVVLGGSDSLKVFRGSSTGLRAPLARTADGAVWDLVVAELTGDGVPDVAAAVAAPGGGTVELFAGLGGGTFAAGVPLVPARSGQNPPALATGDVSHDGHADVVAVWRSTRTVEVLVNFTVQAGAGGWDYWRIVTLTGSQWPEQVAAGDVTGDGNVDVVVTAGGNRPASQLVVVPFTTSGNADAQYTMPSYDIPEPLVVSDVDGDARADVVVAHGGWNAVGVYRQKSAGYLADEQLSAVPYASHYDPRGLAVGDVTGDLRPDVLLADYNNGLVLLAGSCPAYCGT